MLVISCKKEIYYEGEKGTLIGFIVDEDFDPLEGVTVTLEGTDIEAISDTNGKYIFSDLKTDIYTFTYSKKEYGTYKIYGYQFLAGKIPTYHKYNVRLYQTSNLGVNDVTYDTLRKGFIHFYGKVIYDQIQDFDTVYEYSYENNIYFYFPVRYFISDKPEVSGNNYRVTGSLHNSGLSEKHIDSSSFLGHIFTNELKSFKSHQKLYITFDTYKYNTDHYYLDINTGCNVFVNLSGKESKPIQFTVPAFPEY